MKYAMFANVLDFVFRGRPIDAHDTCQLSDEHIMQYLSQMTTRGVLNYHKARLP